MTANPSGARLPIALIGAGLIGRVHVAHARASSEVAAVQSVSVTTL